MASLWQSGGMGVTAVSGLSLITVTGRGYQNVPGLAARALRALSLVQAQVLLFSQSSAAHSFCMVMGGDVAASAVSQLRREFGRDLLRRELADICVEGDVAMLTIAVQGSSASLLGIALTVLGQQRVNILALAQGTPGGSLSLVIAEQDREMAQASLCSYTTAALPGLLTRPLSKCQARGA